MKRINLLLGAIALSASANVLVGCGNSSYGVKINWAEGYEKCSVKLVAENKLILGLKEVSFGALPSNTALSGNVTSTPIFVEDKVELVSEKANIIAARSGDYENNLSYSKKINALCSVLSRNDISEFINTEFSGKVSYAYENLTGYAVETYDEETNTYTPVEAFKGEGTITVAASQTPHAVILNAIKATLKNSYGYDLSVSLMDWQVQNLALSKGEIDANYFQHIPYLNTFVPASGDSELKAIAKIHYEPLGVYKGGKATSDEFYNGASIEICNDRSNAERALELLKDKGYITSYTLSI